MKRKIIRKDSKDITQSKYEIGEKILYLVMLLLFNTTTVFAQEWTQIRKPQVGNIQHLHINKANPNIIYVLSSNKMYKTSDNGITWNSTFTSSDISSVFALAPSDDNIIYTNSWKSSDGGSTWHQITPMINAVSPWTVPRIAINPTNPNIIFVCENANSIHRIKKTTDGGQTWTEVLSNTDLYQIAFSDTNYNILYATGWLNVLKSIDGGKTWKKVYEDTKRFFKGLEIYQDILYSSDASEDENYLPLISSKCLIKSTDGGVTWTELPFNNSKYDIGRITNFKIIEGVIYVTTLKGLYCSHDLGTTWSKKSPDWDNYQSVDVNSTKIVLGSSSHGVSIANRSDMIFKNVGVEPLTINYLKTNNSNTIVCGDYNKIYKYEPYGDYWKSITPPSGESGNIVPFFSKTSAKLFCVKGYNLYSSTDNGEQWTYLSKLPNSSVLGMTVSSDEQKIFISGSSTIMYSLNSGNSWGAVAIPGTSIIDIHYSTSNVLYLSDNTGYYYSLNNGINWQNLNGLPKDITISSRKISYNNINDDKLYVSLSNGAIYVKETDATSWSQIYQGVILQNPLIVGKICNSTDGEKLYAFGNYWYDVYLYRGLFFSNDNGISWLKYSDEFDFSNYNNYYTMPNSEIWFVDKSGNLWKNNSATNVGIIENSLSSITIYPNPTNGVLRIESKELNIGKIEIVDISGKRFSSYHNIPTFSHHLIDISHLKSGVYFIKFEMENRVITHKIIKL